MTMWRELTGTIHVLMGTIHVLDEVLAAVATAEDYDDNYDR